MKNLKVILGTFLVYLLGIGAGIIGFLGMVYGFTIYDIIYILSSFGLSLFVINYQND